jgi:hypothetical protein
MRAWKLTRSGTMDANPMAFVAAAGVFASSIVSGTTLLTTRDDSGLSHYVITPESKNAGQSVQHLAHAVAARADYAEELPVLSDVEKIVWLKTERHPALVSRDTQAGTDPASVSRALAISMQPGQWVAVALRKPSQKERKWALTWLESQLNTSNPQYHSRRSDSLVATFYAGAATTDEAAQLLREAAAAMPGFDMATRPATVSRLKDSLPFLGAGALLTGAGVLLSNPVNLSFADLPAYSPIIGFTAAAATGAWAALLLSGKARGAHARLRSAIAEARLPVSRPLLIPPSKPIKENTDADGKHTAAKGGGYAFTNRGFLVGQEIPVSLVAPHAGAASGEMSTAVREAPATMNQIIGPRIGTSAGKWVALSAPDMWQGIMFLGVPGSGKSVALRNIWAWLGMERAKPSGRPGFQGEQNVVIALETKGAGAAVYKALSDKVGDQVGLADLSDVSTPAIDMFPRIGSLEHQARTITNAMKYVWAEGSIGAHSFNMLTRVFAGALIVDANISAQVPGLRQNASPFYYANILLGGYGDDPALALGSAILSEAARVKATEDDDLGFAAVQLATLFGKGVTPAQRKTATEAPRNKAGALLAAESWWARPTKVSWDDILQNNWGIVVNVGSSAAGGQVDDQLKNDMSAMLMYSLYDAIKRNCIDWDVKKRFVSIFADELTEIAGTSSEIIEWMKDKGRGFGVVPVFATQRAGQLDIKVRESVMGFGTVLAYTQDVPAVMTQIVTDLAADGSAWTNADVANLPPYEAIVRTRIKSTRQAPFTVKLHNFETNMAAYEHLQTVAAPTEIR